MADAPPEVRERLLKAWEGEIVAGGVYELIARRMPDRRAEILRRMAAAEGGHRRRLEQRMQELGIERPDPASVRLPLWLRLQARIAPVDRLLAAREAAEDDEVDDLYKRPTGDAATDKLLHEIRREERSHSRAVQELGPQRRRGREPSLSPRRASRPGSSESSGARRGIRPGGGWISGAIYGANDGLAAVFGIVAGVSGATGGSSFVLTAGVAGAVASALSMATGAYLAERSEAEVDEANVARERQEIAEHPEEEREELSLFYQLKGIDGATADAARRASGAGPGGDAAGAVGRGVRRRPSGRRQRGAGGSGRRGVDRARRDRPRDPVHLHDRHASRS